MIYLISGLGADERIFSKLNFGNHPVTFLPWMTPEKNEMLEKYVSRFSQKINLNEDIILLGVSFGGIMAVELGKLLPAKKIILVSSIKRPDELPYFMKLIKRTRIYKVFPASRLRKRFHFLSLHFLGSKTPEEIKVINEMMDNSDNSLIDWSIQSIFNWTNQIIPENLYHIHGTKDRTFPIHYVRQPFPVKNGNHFMVYNRADEISKIIHTILNN